MTKHRSQNSILVLATLGVYLGLMLAGATPQILAQAAMTRQFDIKDEIEFKDDLDKKPKRLDDPAFIFDSTGEAFVDEYNELVTGTGRQFDGRPLDVHPKFPAYSIEPECTRWVSIRDAFAIRDLKYEISDCGFESQISLTKSSPQVDVHAYFEEIRNVLRSRHHGSAAAKDFGAVLTNTKVSLADDQIFVTTRLPRAGLDSLLASDAK